MHELSSASSGEKVEKDEKMNEGEQVIPDTVIICNVFSFFSVIILKFSPPAHNDNLITSFVRSARESICLRFSYRHSDEEANSVQKNPEKTNKKKEKKFGQKFSHTDRTI